MTEQVRKAFLELEALLYGIMESFRQAEPGSLSSRADPAPERDTHQAPGQRLRASLCTKAEPRFFRCFEYTQIAAVQHRLNAMP